MLPIVTTAAFPWFPCRREFLHLADSG